MIAVRIVVLILMQLYSDVYNVPDAVDGRH